MRGYIYTLVYKQICCAVFVACIHNTPATTILWLFPRPGNRAIWQHCFNFRTLGLLRSLDGQKRRPFGNGDARQSVISVRWAYIPFQQQMNRRSCVWPVLFSLQSIFCIFNLYIHDFQSRSNTDTLLSVYNGTHFLDRAMLAVYSCCPALC